jgi:hypothetical protein
MSQITQTEQRFQRMTDEHLPPPNSLLTLRDMVMELERLAIHFPRTDMDSAKWKVLFLTFHEDCKHLSFARLREACRRYRQNPDNRFFPTPGQLLGTLKTGFDAVYISPPKPKLLPEPELSPETIAERQRIVAEFAKSMRVSKQSSDREEPQAYTTVETQRHSELAPRLLANLQARLTNGQHNG